MVLMHLRVVSHLFDESCSHMCRVFPLGSPPKMEAIQEDPLEENREWIANNIV